MGRSGQTAVRHGAVAPVRAAAPRWRLVYRIPGTGTSWTTELEASERSEAEFRGRLALQEAFTPRGSVRFVSSRADWWREFELAGAEPVG